MADFNTMTTEELQALWADRERARSAGESVVLPDRRDAVGFSSATTKSIGHDGAVAGMHGENFSYYEPWGFRSPRVDRRVQRAMLAKNLHQVGYRPKASAWDNLGAFLKDGFRHHKSGEFEKRHFAPFQAVPGAFWKARGMNTVYGPQGGFLVQPEFAPSIEELIFPNDIPDRIKMLPFSGPIVRLPRSKDTDRSDGRRSSGAYATWIEEGKAIGSASMEVDFRELRLKKLAVVVYATEEVLNDTDYAVEQFMRSKIQEEFNFQLARTIFWGNGGAEPLGFGTASNKIIVAAEGGQSADTIVAANLLKMESRFFEAPGARPVFLHHRSCTPQIGQLSIGNFPVMIDSHQGGFASRPSQTIRGIEAVPSEFCAALGDQGDIWLADLSQYVAINRKTIREDVSIHVEFLSDQQAFRFIFGFDGAPLHDNPVKPYQAGATAVPTQAPFVCIAAR